LVSDEPSNAASEYAGNVFAFFYEHGAPHEELVQASVTDDAVYSDRRSGPTFPDADAESMPMVIRSSWETGTGQPRFEHQVVAVRGDRFAALVIQTDYGNGFLRESIIVVGLDATLSKLQRHVDFDIDDVDGAIAELDQVHSQADAN
jgi:hypothetical protein